MGIRDEWGLARLPVLIWTQWPKPQLERAAENTACDVTEVLEEQPLKKT